MVLRISRAHFSFISIFLAFPQHAFRIPQRRIAEIFFLEFYWKCFSWIPQPANADSWILNFLLIKTLFFTQPTFHKGGLQKVEMSFRNKLLYYDPSFRIPLKRVEEGGKVFFALFCFFYFCFLPFAFAKCGIQNFSKYSWSIILIPPPPFLLCEMQNTKF